VTHPAGIFWQETNRGYFNWRSNFEGQHNFTLPSPAELRRVTAVLWIDARQPERLPAKHQAENKST